MWLMRGLVGVGGVRVIIAGIRRGGGWYVSERASEWWIDGMTGGCFSDSVEWEGIDLSGVDVVR